MNIESFSSGLNSVYTSAMNLTQKFTPDHIESYLACYSIFQSLNAVYEERTKELGESTWTPFNYVQAGFCLTAGLVHLYVTCKNIESNNRIKEIYLNNEDKLSSDKKEVFIVARSNSDNNAFMGALNLFPAKLHSDLNKINSTCPVVFKEFSDIKEIITSEKKLLEKGKILQGLAILTHSNKNFITFGGKEDFVSTGKYPHRKSEVEQLAEFRLRLTKEEYDSEFERRKQDFAKSTFKNDKKFKKLLSLLDKDAQIVLHACNAGKGTFNIAEHISKLGEGRQVIAAHTAIDGCALKIENNTVSSTPKFIINFSNNNDYAVTGLLLGLNLLSLPPQFCSLGIMLSNAMLSVRLALPISHYLTGCDTTNTLKVTN